MELPNRKLPRLKNYDYAMPNYYFVTICTHNKQYLFGEPDQLNDYGLIAKLHINQIFSHFAGVQIDKYVIMPNHIHCIVKVGCSVTEERSRPFPTLSSIIGLYKSGVTREIHKSIPQLKIWQKSFHDHIIRNEKDYQKIWEYIDTNPLKWKEDCFYEIGNGTESCAAVCSKNSYSRERS